MNKNLIGVSGKKRSGKNTVASIINKLITKNENIAYYNDPRGYNAGKTFGEWTKYEEKSFAYLVKKFASELTGIPLDGWETEVDKALPLGPEWDYYEEREHEVTKYSVKKQMTRRMMLKKLGSDACNQNLHPNCWVNGLFQNYDELKSNWLITDVRFPQEVEAIKQRGGIVIRVVRPATEDKDAHISETALDNYNEFDFVIMNDTNLEDLEEKVENILMSLGLL